MGVDPSATAISGNRRRDRNAHHRYEVGPAQDLPLRALGFADPRYTPSRDQTGILTATKPR